MSTDAYWRAGRQSELIEIVRYTVDVGLVPMLMTHGQTLIEHPDFLEALVMEGGLRQVAVHIDMTQAGRHGYPIARIKSESDLHPVRQAFTDLAQDIRERTGLPLELAHNCTVTERNIASIAGRCALVSGRPRAVPNLAHPEFSTRGKYRPDDFFSEPGDAGLGLAKDL